MAVMAAAVLLLSGCGDAAVPQENRHPYDYYIDCTTREQVEVLAGMDFVAGVFPFSLMQFVLPDNGTGEEQRLMVLATEAFDKIDFSSFERKDLLEEDESILQAAERNPIIIDEALSKANDLRVGDTFAIPSRLTETPTVFTVGAIYRRTALFAKYDAVILCNEEMNPAFFAVDKDMGYHAAYLKAADREKLTEYLENEFFPALLAKNGELTQEEMDATPREEVAAYYEDYTAHGNRSR